MPDLENAELSILISDEWQGKGIGKILMEYSIGIAKEIGLKSLWMEILKNPPDAGAGSEIRLEAGI